MTNPDSISLPEPSVRTISKYLDGLSKQWPRQLQLIYVNQPKSVVTAITTS